MGLRDQAQFAAGFRAGSSSDSRPLLGYIGLTAPMGNPSPPTQSGGSPATVAGPAAAAAGSWQPAQLPAAAAALGSSPARGKRAHAGPSAVPAGTAAVAADADLHGGNAARLAAALHGSRQKCMMGGWCAAAAEHASPKKARTDILSLGTPASADMAAASTPTASSAAQVPQLYAQVGAAAAAACRAGRHTVDAMELQDSPKHAGAGYGSAVMMAGRQTWQSPTKLAVFGITAAAPGAAAGKSTGGAAAAVAADNSSEAARDQQPNSGQLNGTGAQPVQRSHMYFGDYINGGKALWQAGVGFKVQHLLEKGSLIKELLQGLAQVADIVQMRGKPVSNSKGRRTYKTELEFTAAAFPHVPPGQLLAKEHLLPTNRISDSEEGFEAAFWISRSVNVVTSFREFKKEQNIQSRPGGINVGRVDLRGFGSGQEVD